MAWIKVIISLLLLILSITAFFIAHSRHKLNYDYIADQYGVLMDAGSSHTGIFLYKWKPRELPSEQKSLVAHGVMAGIPTDIKQIKSIDIKPGIADIKNLKGVKKYFAPAETLNQDLSELIDMKKADSDPSKPHQLVPLYLEATAGMRLLEERDGTMAITLHHKIEEVIGNYSMMTLKHARTITGTFEGLYSWITVNFLTHALEAAKDCNAIIECGGASTQIAHEMKVDDSDEAVKRKKVTEDEIHNLSIFGRKRHIRSTSYLCYGKDEFLRRVYRLLIDEHIKNNNSTDYGVTAEIKNPCSNPGLKATVIYKDLKKSPCVETKAGVSEGDLTDETSLTFIGTAGPKQCEALIKRIIKLDECDKFFVRCANNYVDLMQRKPKSKSKWKIYAISAFYYAAKSVGATSLDNKATMTVDNDTFIRKTEEFCHRVLSNEEVEKNRFLRTQCFSNILCKMLITDLYKIKDWGGIIFAKKVGNDEVGWTLGSMLFKARQLAVNRRTEIHLADWAYVTIVVLCILISLVSLVIFIWGSVTLFFSEESEDTELGETAVPAKRFGHSFTKR